MSTNFKAPDYVPFSSPVLVHLSWVQILSSAYFTHHKCLLFAQSGITHFIPT